MKTATKLSWYGLALAAVAAGAWTIGTPVGPLGDDQAHSGPAGIGHAMGAEEPAGASADQLPGLAAAANGYRLDLGTQTVSAGSSQPFRFRVLGPDGTAVTRFAVEHDKRLHLVLVRRDTSGYQHVHPELAGDGTWSVPLTLPSAGSYRVFADFTPEGRPRTTLGADVHVAGDYQPKQFNSPVRTAMVDGYEVRLAGDLVPGKETTVIATVTRGGSPVTDLQPYLGAYGHLVALRAADLGYLHVHPLGEPGDGTTPAGPQIRFAVTVPTAGTYRLFLDFQHDGHVRTAEFTVTATGSAVLPTPAPPTSAGHDGHG